MNTDFSGSYPSPVGCSLFLSQLPLFWEHLCSSVALTAFSLSSRVAANKVLFRAVLCRTKILDEKCGHKQARQRDRLASGSAPASANRKEHCRFANGVPAIFGVHRHVHAQGQVEASIPLMLSEGEQPFETARGFFLEGHVLYPAAGFRELDHIQDWGSLGGRPPSHAALHEPAVPVRVTVVF
jgi:hypothetical protein